MAKNAVGISSKHLPLRFNCLLTYMNENIINTIDSQPINENIYFTYFGFYISPLVIFVKL